MTQVDDVLAFVWQHGVLTKELLLADEETEELSADEQNAIDKVLPHVRSQWIELLRTCRRSAIKLGDGADGDFSVMDTRRPRDDILWRNRFVEVILVTRGASWQAWLMFHLTTDEKDIDAPYKLYAELRTLKGRRPLLDKIVESSSQNPTAHEWGYRFDGIQPRQGDDFTDLAERSLQPVWPLAEQLVRKLWSEGAG